MSSSTRVSKIVKRDQKRARFLDRLSLPGFSSHLAQQNEKQKRAETNKSKPFPSLFDLVNEELNEINDGNGNENVVKNTKKSGERVGGRMNKIPLGGKLSNKVRQQLARSESSQLTAVIQHSSFRDHPLTSIRQHLLFTRQQEEKKNQQEKIRKIEQEKAMKQANSREEIRRQKAMEYQKSKAEENQKMKNMNRRNEQMEEEWKFPEE